MAGTIASVTWWDVPDKQGNWKEIPKLSVVDSRENKNDEEGRG